MIGSYFEPTPKNLVNSWTATIHNTLSGNIGYNWSRTKDDSGMYLYYIPSLLSLVSAVHKSNIERHLQAECMHQFHTYLHLGMLIMQDTYLINMSIFKTLKYQTFLFGRI